MHVPAKYEISPTLRDIVNQFDEDNRRPPDVFPVAQQPMIQEEIDDYDHSEVEGNAFDDCSFDHNDHASFGQEDRIDALNNTDGDFTSHADVCIMFSMLFGEVLC